MKSRKTIKFCTPAQSIILDVFLSRKYIQIDPTEEEEVSDDSDVDSEEEEEDTEEEEKLGPMSWDIMWTRTKWVKNNILGDNGHPLRLRKEQRVNHFPNSYQLTRKDLMFGNLERYAWKLKKVKKSDVLDFSPKTYFLPQLWALWRAEFRDSNDIWIAKPIAGSQGIGIKFIRDLEEAIDFREKSYDKYLNAKSTKEQLKNTYVVQKYISNPYLIDGRKFDIRFYVLTLSYKPLVVYVFREGFCRFSTQKYNLRNLDADIHLTNVAVQVQSAQYDA
ncbi:hypothetical protein TRFO_03175 [Tritrichomonas foetus]|uniref:Tubulin--tyrosine ligase-like protein 9 n=1 Tax=Tritrichomonas foetus TaxID=1144522 RepID=A0A1J4KS71_9EUKA|nr:hypothetical protein TRFO_03175 [Tritrichomonas foetus]|eukprot:OHT14137.1 hypothetical protein TRFO_03175 [Tritrichomonas foetus]